MLNISILVTTVGLLVPFFFYSFAMVLTGFTLLCIGNTKVQVLDNLLLIDVVLVCMLYLFFVSIFAIRMGKKISKNE